MSRLPQLERLLVEEARRQDAAARHGRRRSAWAAQRRLVLIVLLVLLAFASVAVAATQLLPEGKPVPVPKQTGGYVHRFTGPSQVLDLRVADPAGGLPWGLRTTRTRPTGGLGCTQVGRVQDGKLGVIGRDGAFGDDGRFHVLPKEVLQSCGGLDSDGHGYLRADGVPATASGLGAGDGSGTVGGCETNRFRRMRTVQEPRTILVDLRLAERQGNHAEIRRLKGDLRKARASAARKIRSCPAADLRTIYYGMVGTRASAVDLQEPGAPRRTVSLTPGGEGAYVFVLPGAEEDHHGIQLTVRYPDGLACPQGGIAGRPKGVGIAGTRKCEEAMGFVHRKPKPGAKRTATQRILARMAARRARAAKHPLDVPVQGLPAQRIRFVPPLRGLHAYQLQIACTAKISTAMVTKRLRGGRRATVDIPGSLRGCHLPAKGTVTQAGTGRKIGRFVLSKP